MISEGGPDLVFLVGFCISSFFCYICRLSFWHRCCGKLLFLAIDCIVSHSFCFLSGFSGREGILDI
jgi:hypothetical protein